MIFHLQQKKLFFMMPTIMMNQNCNSMINHQSQVQYPDKWHSQFDLFIFHFLARKFLNIFHPCTDFPITFSCTCILDDIYNFYVTMEFDWILSFKCRFGHYIVVLIVVDVAVWVRNSLDSKIKVYIYIHSFIIIECIYVRFMWVLHLNDDHSFVRIK